MNGAEAPENRVPVLRRALMYFAGVGLPEAKFRFTGSCLRRARKPPSRSQSVNFPQRRFRTA